MWQTGDIIDRYVLISRVGRGAQAEVWRASDRSGVEVALKLTRESPDEAINERVRREARALCAVSHPAVLQARGVFEDPSRGVLGMELEWIDGVDLDRMKGVLTMRARRAALFHVAAGLASLHREGIVHRDLKLANVLIRHDFEQRPTDAGQVKIADLGVASRASTLTEAPQPISPLGTLPSLAPELFDQGVFRTVEPHPTQDVFAFGVAGFELLFGHHPTGLASDASARDYVHAYRDAASNPGAWLAGSPLDDPTMRAIKRALRLAPTERPQSGAELVRIMREG